MRELQPDIFQSGFVRAHVGHGRHSAAGSRGEAACARYGGPESRNATRIFPEGLQRGNISTSDDSKPSHQIASRVQPERRGQSLLGPNTPTSAAHPVFAGRWGSTEVPKEPLVSRAGSNSASSLCGGGGCFSLRADTA